MAVNWALTHSDANSPHMQVNWTHTLIQDEIVWPLFFFSFPCRKHVVPLGRWKNRKTQTSPALHYRDGNKTRTSDQNKNAAQRHLTASWRIICENVISQSRTKYILIAFIMSSLLIPKLLWSIRLKMCSKQTDCMELRLKI